MSKSLRPRIGISLMEVLISIGVVSIGLLGVVSLIPVASQLAEEGTQNDRKANVGRRSFREFSVRGFDEPGKGPIAEMNWIGYDEYIPAAPILQQTRVFSAPNAGHPNGLFQLQPFCIDPQYVAAQRLDTGVFMFGVNGYRDRFLFAKSSDAVYGRMPVISLANGSGVAPHFMSQEQAEEVFVFQDDLEFDAPAKNGDSPTQVFLGANAKRYAKGYFSWFVTVVPQIVETAVGLEYTSRATLSTVVCYQRNTFVPLNATTDFGTIVNVPPALDGSTSGFYTEGKSGGDVRVQWPLQKTEVPSSGDWVLLGRNLTNGTSTPFDDEQYFKWYRVVFSGERTPTAMGGLQDLSLVGEDWDIVTPGSVTSVTWLPEVVSVYSKQIQVNSN
jgi:hypothetical protein